MYYWGYDIVEFLEKRLGKYTEKGHEKWWKLPTGMVKIHIFQDGPISTWVQVISHGKDDLFTTKRNGYMTLNLGEFTGDLLDALEERIS